MLIENALKTLSKSGFKVYRDGGWYCVDGATKKIKINVRPGTSDVSLICVETFDGKDFWFRRTVKAAIENILK